MHGWRWLLDRWQTRIANRTFGLFAVCSAVPIAVFAALSYQIVERDIHKRTDERLVLASKNYGLLVYDRLRQTDSLLTMLAEQYLNDRLALPALREFSSERFRIVEVTHGAATAQQPGAWRIERSLRVIADHTYPRVWVEISASNSARRITLTAEPSPDYLWDHDAVALEDSGLCVFDTEHRPLHCVQSAGSELHMQVSAQTQSDAQLREAGIIVGEWPLFLQASYGAPAWVIRTYQSAASANANVTAFRRTIPVVAALAIVSAFLLSSIQIRRSHEPLKVLMAAAQRIGRRRLRTSVKITTRDEYGHLAQAFNRMGARLRDQFSLLATLIRVDRGILSRAGAADVIGDVLPALPRVLKCDVVAVALLADGGSGVVHAAARRKRQCERINLAQLDAATLAQMPVRWEKIEALQCERVVESLRALGVAAVCGVPIALNGKLRGALLLGRRSAAGLRAIARRRVAGIADRLAVAIGNEDHERALLQQAFHDSLTGLPNREMLRRKLEAELRRNDGTTGGALLFIDVDRFKNVNDTLGHSVGDELLKCVAERFASVMRSADILARIGGDEFIVIAPGATTAAAASLAGRLQEALHSPLQLQAVQYVAAASLGIAMYPSDGDSVESLLRNADLALYRAKAGGRGRAAFFDAQMNEDAMRRLDLEQRLRRALENNQLTMHFQPQIRAADEAIMGAEALARWLAPNGVQISPAEFIPIAEEIGLIHELGAWALRTACSALRSWRARGIDLRCIAVNVSMQQLREPGFADLVIDCLRDHGLSGDSLEIELTESLLAEKPEAVATQLRRLTELGVRIAIDDFGTGYSSMASLQHFPVSALKIDKSFVSDCAHNPNARALVQALLSVGRALEKSVVAEGVEQEEQRRTLQAMGCGIMQGYLFARPMPEAQFEQFYRNRVAPQPVSRAADG